MPVYHTVTLNGQFLQCWWDFTWSAEFQTNAVTSSRRAGDRTHSWCFCCTVTVTLTEHAQKAQCRLAVLRKGHFLPSDSGWPHKKLWTLSEATHHRFIGPKNDMVALKSSHLFKERISGCRKTKQKKNNNIWYWCLMETGWMLVRTCNLWMGSPYLLEEHQLISENRGQKWTLWKFSLSVGQSSRDTTHTGELKQH